MNGRAGALERLEAGLGYTFRSRELLEEALRHSSAANEQGVSSYERLEFLGDAALSHAVAALLFARWPDASEGQLTRARAVLVKEPTLARIATALGMADALEVASGVRPGASLLADGLESVLGALLVEGGWRAFQGAVRRLFAGALEALEPSSLGLEEPKSTLQELAQRQGLELPDYREVSVEGPAHRRTYVFEVVFDGRVLARGEGSSKRTAQQAAARLALEVLGAAPRSAGGGHRGR